MVSSLWAQPRVRWYRADVVWRREFALNDKTRILLGDITFTRVGRYDEWICDQDKDYRVVGNEYRGYRACYQSITIQPRKGIFSFKTLRGAQRVIINILKEGL